MDLPSYSAPALSAAMAADVIREAVGEAGIGAKGRFPGPLFLAIFISRLVGLHMARARDAND